MVNRESLKAYCSVCQQATEMEFIGIDEEIDLIWIRCSGCNGIFSYNAKSTGASKNDNPK